MALVGLLRSRAALEAEVLILRHQLNVLRRKRPKRVVLSNIDRVVFAGLYRLAPGVLDALKILRPETVIGWHRAGFRAYWRRKSTWGSPHTPRVNCIARQLTEAYGDVSRRRSLTVRDRDACLWTYLHPPA